MKPILEIQNISKKYSIQNFQGGYLSLRERLVSAITLQKNKTEDFWALKDISFDVYPGDSIAIIGRNGAGKSTLLKILSKITPPTSGQIIARGRVASLLEVGTGFHPELTGRENIFFNGSLLGMKRREIEKNFDAIVDFSGVEFFLDTPLKHFSSGMQLRLAFAVAAFLEPEILIIDEVLAVGDAEFQKKCIGKMEDVSSNGRTILFVSHNLAAVSQLCKKAVLLRQGQIVEAGESIGVIQSYIQFTRNQNEVGRLINLEVREGSGDYRVQQIRILNERMEPVDIVQTGSPVVFEFMLDKSIEAKPGSFRMDFAIDDERDQRIGWYSTDVVPISPKNKFQMIQLKIDKFQFGAGMYYLTFYSTMNGIIVDYLHQGFSFTVEEGDFFGTGKVIPKSQTFIYADHQIFLD